MCQTGISLNALVIITILIFFKGCPSSALVSFISSGTCSHPCYPFSVCHAPLGSASFSLLFIRVQLLAHLTWVGGGGTDKPWRMWWSSPEGWQSCRGTLALGGGRRGSPRTVLASGVGSPQSTHSSLPQLFVASKDWPVSRNTQVGQCHLSLLESVVPVDPALPKSWLLQILALGCSLAAPLHFRIPPGPEVKVPTSVQFACLLPKWMQSSGQVGETWCGVVCVGKARCLRALSFQNPLRPCFPQLFYIFWLSSSFL